MIVYKTYHAKADAIEDLLRKIGIEYKSTYIPSSVPCQSKTELRMKPKNELEALACFGLIG